MWNELVVIVRRLAHKPSYTIPAILALGMAIGANTAIFSIVNTVLLRPLPYPDSSQLTVVNSVRLSTKKSSAVSYQDLREWRRQSTLISHFAGMYPWKFTVLVRGEPEVIETAFLSATFFEMTAVKPVVGRTFTTAEEDYLAAPVVMISKEFWEREMGADPAAIGKPLRMDSKEYTIIGVLDGRAKFPVAIQKAELWIPMRQSPGEPRSVRAATVVARMKPGVTVRQAQSEMDGIAAQLARDVSADAGFGVLVTPLEQQMVGNVRSALWLLQGAVGLLLLIACANVAHLALVAAIGRAHEIGIESALGASRGRIVRELAAEGLLLGFAGAVLGTALAALGVRFFLLHVPYQLPRLNELQLDRAVLAFTIAISCLTALLFSVAPAVVVFRSEVAGFLRSGRGAIGAASSRRLRGAFVISEVALAVMLSIGAGTLVRSFLEILETPWGFQPNHVLATNVVLPYTIYGMGPKASAFFEKALDNVRQIPGVRASGLCLTLPFSGDGLTVALWFRDRPDPPAGQEFRARYRGVSPGYFQAIGIPFASGRDFNNQDRYGAPGVVIIDETLARQVWPGRNPLGQRLRTKVHISAADPVEFEVVGVVGDIRDSQEDAAPSAHIYVPQLQQGWSVMSLVVRTDGDPLALSRDVGQAFRTVDPTQALQEVNTMEDRISQSVAQPRLYAFLLTGFAAIGLGMACIGIYGAIAYSVETRTRELGLRMALGAAAGDLLGLIVREGGVLVGAGLAIGAGGALALTRSLAALNAKIHGITPAVFCLVLILVAMAGVAACYIPARRALRLDPAMTLRHE